MGEKEEKEDLKNKAVDKIKEIEDKLDKGSISEEDQRERAMALSNLWELKKKENKDTNQKFKNKWCLEGDENSRLFHRNLNKRKRKRSIKGILTDGIWQTEPIVIKNAFFQHFEKRFKNVTLDTWTQDFSDIKKLSDEQRNNMESPFTQ